MTPTVNTVLIIGATSGIGEAFARKFHAAGKKVIVTGRRTARLQQLKEELAGLETVEWDVSDLKALPSRVAEILNAYPTLDTVFINAGIQRCFSLLESPAPTAPEPNDQNLFVDEIQVNLTAPILLTRAFLPHLLARAAASQPAALLVTSSSLAFHPLPFYPVYCATKAAVHAFIVSLREQLGFAPANIKQALSVVEVVPPYTDTALDAASRAHTVAMQGGPEKAFAPMPLGEYIEAAWAKLETPTADGKLPKEVGVGFGEMGVNQWRESFGANLAGMGFDV
ncbi:putative short chain dehydrogenase [Aspergillus homomorphus CBS 101889]|uniref:NAD(P)-binding protein n=1 Tax=Aspergillus homomorphus (strain CBS 101889) TaxID=1450537 RepID=A0A395I8P0_ASPHC|nr:NAD(P)-binding protein [Aspergillus homomorphus CBS 101889]RAL16640.1 NAD(P)-binding protein [Aspergillus homomorphus CBS 101889]